MLEEVESKIANTEFKFPSKELNKDLFLKVESYSVVASYFFMVIAIIVRHLF
jgi:hypothetical protein